MAKVSFRQIDDIIKKTRKDDEVFKFDAGEDRIEIVMNSDLSIDDTIAFADSVADALFVNGEYKPALRPFVFFKALLAYFTNIKTEGLSNERLAGLYYGIGRQIERRIDDDIMVMLDEAVERKVKFMLDCALSVEHRRLNDAIESLNAEKDMIYDQMNRLIDVFGRLADSTEGLDKEALMADIKAIAGKSETEIANAVLDRQEAKEQ